MADNSVELATGYISLAVSSKGLGRDISRQFAGVEKQAGTSGKKAGANLGAGMLGAAGKIAGPLAALFAIDKLAGFMKDANAEARESQKVGAVTAQIIKATGSASKVTAAQVGALATKISLKTGVDDEAIQSGSNLLLTFKKVRNEAGKGGAVFDRATKAAVDLSKAGFGSITGSSKMLGKALNDPVKGISALSRAGVTFTAQQKKQIKTLVESGKTLEAQKIILGEVESQVGGVAEKSATAGEKMTVAFGNIKELLGTALLPAVDAVANILTRKFFPALSRTITFLSAKGGPILARVSKSVGIFFDAFTGRSELNEFDGKLRLINNAGVLIGGWLTDAGKGIKIFFDALTGQSELNEFAGGLKTVNNLGVILGDWIRTKLVPAFMGIVGAGQRLAVVVLPIIKAIVREFMERWPTIKPIIMGIFKTIGGIVVDVMGLIQSRIQTVTKVVQFIWSRWGKQITALTGDSFHRALAIIGGVMKVIGGIVKVVTGLMTGDWRKAGTGIKQIVGGLRDVLVAIFGKMATQIKGAVTDLMAKLKGKFRDGVAAIGAAWDHLKDLAKKPISFIINTVINGGLLKAFNKIAGIVGANKIDNISIPGFNRGGIESGKSSWRGGDTMLRGFRPGEGVTVSEALTDPHERARLLALNKWTMAGRSAASFREKFGFASGGLVGGSGRFSSLFASRLLLAQKMAHSQFQIYQRGFRPATSYSGTSHQGDAIDARVNMALLRASRRVGIPMWDRTGKGNWISHMHGVPLPGAGHAAGSAVWQAQDYLRGGDGLGGRDNGPKVGVLAKIGAFLKAGFSSFAGWFGSLIKDPLAKLKDITGTPFGSLAAGVPRLLVEGLKKKVTTFDTGGTLPPGLSLAYNGTRQPERVLTTRQWQNTQRSARDGAKVENHFHGPFGPTAEQIAQASVNKMRNALVTLEYAGIG